MCVIVHKAIYVLNVLHVFDSSRRLGEFEYDRPAPIMAAASTSWLRPLASVMNVDPLLVAHEFKARLSQIVDYSFWHLLS